MGKRKRARVSEQKQTLEDEQQMDEDHNASLTNEKTLYEVFMNSLLHFA